MAKKEEIVSSFDELNITVDDQVITKCLELCRIYNIDAEELCDQWYAFTASSLNGAPPTVELLEKMERKVCHKNQSFFRNKHEEIPEIKSYDKNAALTPQSKKIEGISYTPTPRTPTSQSTEESQSSQSSEKFLKRTDCGYVQITYGPTTAQFKREDNVVLPVREVEGHKIPRNLRYMYQIARSKQISMNNVMYNLGHDIMQDHGLQLSDELLFRKMGEMVTYGRIISDADGKINEESILLEGGYETNLHRTVRLNLSNIESYSLFPGQVIVAKGNNVKYHAFVAEQIYTKARLELPEEPPLVKSNAQIVVAAGPFTLTENLSYEPLHGLIEYVKKKQPHILILMGPFLDQTNKIVENANLTQSFDSFFEDLVENIMNSVEHLDIHVVMVSSHRDVHHHPVYPTPPYHIRENYKKLTIVSDPGVIEIDGLRIMMTTADILLHMTQFELFSNKQFIIQTKKMERMASHILAQNNIYPLYPPPEDLSIDHELLEQYGILKLKPHILILPSSMKGFVKEIDDCLVVNPERLTTGFQGGTFARIEIEAGSTRSICGRTALQVLRV